MQLIECIVSFIQFDCENNIPTKRKAANCAWKHDDRLRCCHYYFVYSERGQKSAIPAVLLIKEDIVVNAHRKRTTKGSQAQGNLHFKEVIGSCSGGRSGGWSISNKVQWADTSLNVEFGRIKLHAYVPGGAARHVTCNVITANLWKLRRWQVDGGGGASSMWDVLQSPDSLWKISRALEDHVDFTVIFMRLIKRIDVYFVILFFFLLQETLA